MIGDNSNSFRLHDFFVRVGNLFPKKSESKFIAALTHTSANSKPGANFEQLEFLGDAVLSLIVAEYLYQKYPKKKEGELTKLRSYLVSRNQLNEVAHTISLYDFIIHEINDKQLLVSRDLGGNVIEAIIGAYYLDGGLKSAKEFVMRHILSQDKVEHLLDKYENSKSKLFEWVQKRKKKIEFRHINSNVQSPKEFEVRIFIDQKEYGNGRGTTIKQAEQIAAKNTLNIIFTNAGQGHLIKDY